MISVERPSVMGKIQLVMQYSPRNISPCANDKERPRAEGLGEERERMGVGDSKKGRYLEP